jgi:hypothetical protein
VANGGGGEGDRPDRRDRPTVRRSDHRRTTDVRQGVARCASVDAGGRLPELRMGEATRASPVRSIHLMNENSRAFSIAETASLPSSQASISIM